MRQVRALRMSVLGLALGLSACTIFKPIPEPGPGLLFFAPSADAASAAVPQPDCSHGGRAPNCFYGGMGELLSSVEAKTQHYRQLSRDVVNENAIYNALLYPAGAAVVYEKLRGAPNRNFLLPAAIAAAVHGVFTGGINDRDKRYLAGAVAMRCLQAKHGVWLYRTDEIDGVRDDSLKSVRDSLQVALDRYLVARADIIRIAKPKPATAKRDAISAARYGAGGEGGADSRALFYSESAAKIQIIRAKLAALDKFRGSLDAAAWQLAMDAQDIEQQLEANIGQAARPLLDPFEVGTTMLAKLKPKLDPSSDANGAATAFDADFRIEVTQGLDEATRQRVIELSQIWGDDVKTAWEKAQAFLNRHEKAASTTTCALLVQSTDQGTTK